MIIKKPNNTMSLLIQNMREEDKNSDKSRALIAFHLRLKQLSFLIQPTDGK